MRGKTMDRKIRRQGSAVVMVLLIVAVTGACAGTDRGSTRPPTATATPSASSVLSAFPSAVAGTARPGPTAIVAEGLPAPALDALVNGDEPFDLASLRGHATLVFFGYTHCPDVCPATIGELMQVVDRRPDVRVVFVTVDPERDTPEFLAKWTEYMPDGFVGVTGSPTAIRTAADAWGVRYARVDSASAAGYSMSHTAFVYLIDRDGLLRLSFPFGTVWETMLDTLDDLTAVTQEARS